MEIDDRSAFAKFWPRLADWPLGPRIALAAILLAVEIQFVTYRFEFRSGPMRQVANSIALSGLFVGLVTFGLLVALRPRNGAGQIAPRPLVWSPLWCGAHVGLFLAFHRVTAELHGHIHPAAVGWNDSVIWLLLAFGVALSGALISLPARWMLALIRRNWPHALAAIVVAGAMAGLTPKFRLLWHVANPPAIGLVEKLLGWFPGHATIRPGPAPTIGTSRVLLIVTRHCSEIEAHLTYALLGATIMLAAGRRTWRFVFIGPFLAGFIVLYVLNGLRLYLLLLVGHFAVFYRGEERATTACVKLAHSRAGSLVFLVVIVLMLLVAERLSRREWMARGDETAEPEAAEPEVEPSGLS